MSADEEEPTPVVRRARRDELARARRRRWTMFGAIAVVVAVLGGVTLAIQLGGDSSQVDAAADTTTTTSSRAVPSTAPPTSTTTTTTEPPLDALPESGTGRRVVFSVERQRMWWVDDAGTVLRTSLVSGRPNTPQTGTFQVYSKTLNATGIDGSRMDYFVRFTKGPNGWAIGFHDIPEKGGVPVQTEEQLGQPLSHGCIRQREADATFTWDFLQVGDTVVVVA